MGTYDTEPTERHEEIYMSTTEQERETEVVVGTIDSVVKKREDTWQIVVKPDGSQYTKNLWTKSASLVGEADASLGQRKTFECNVSYWENKDGKQVRSLWLEKMTEGGDGNQADPAETAAAVLATAQSRMSGGVKFNTGDGNDAMTKEEWARKDSAIHMMAAIKTAADALKHTLPSDPTSEDLNTFLERCKTLSYNWWKRAEAVRAGDDSDLPFLSQQDSEIPY